MVCVLRGCLERGGVVYLFAICVLLPFMFSVLSQLLPSLVLALLFIQLFVYSLEAA